MGYHRMSIPAAIGLLREAHGDAKAGEVARMELRRARRARSRKQFNFWREIAIRLESEADQAPNSNDGGNHPM
jgi:hypothetical protein